MEKAKGKVQKAKMGYDLHITRAKHWTDSDNHPIAAVEWLTLVKDDDELTITGVHGVYFAVWDGESQHEEPWLDWEAGRIFTKNADYPLREKMVAIAKLLNATVQGDDGEVYVGDGLTIHPGAESSDELSGNAPTIVSKIKRLFGS